MKYLIIGFVYYLDIIGRAYSPSFDQTLGLRRRVVGMAVFKSGGFVGIFMFIAHKGIGRVL